MAEGLSLRQDGAIAYIEMDGLSYEQYFKKVEEMIEDLRQQWQAEERVKALKIGIQLTKLLADTSQLKLYSKKYKMVTDVLDEFGNLVYKRIHLKAKGEQIDKQPFPRQVEDTIQSRIDAREQAKETCRNWFMKVASIRELVPRFYTELAILKSCDILLKNSTKGFGIQKEQFYFQTLKRLSKVAWGFGEPIVAIHARAYLCKLAEKLMPKGFDCIEDSLFEVLLMNLEDGTNMVTLIDTSSILAAVQVQNVDLILFFDLISNGLQMMLNIVTDRFIVYSESDEIPEEAKGRLNRIFERLVVQIKKEECANLSQNIILHSLFKALPPDIIAQHSQEILDNIQSFFVKLQSSGVGIDCKNASMSTLYAPLSSFAIALDESDLFERETSDKVKDLILTTIDSILSELFQHETTSDHPISLQYLRCSTAWISFANHYQTGIRVDKLLKRIVEQLKVDRHIDHFSIILDIIKILITNKRNIREVNEIFALPSFSHLLQLLRKDSHKFEASRWILETIRSNFKLNYKLEQVVIADRVTVDFLLRLFATLNETLSLMLSPDDIEHLSQLIEYFLDRFSIPDYREHLDLLTRCRASVNNLNPILEYLTRKVFDFASKAKDYERKRSSRRNYFNGCLAFSFVTVPAINDPLTRLQLFIRGAQLALEQMSLSLADYHLKQALIILNELTHLKSNQNKCKTGDVTTNESYTSRESNLYNSFTYDTKEDKLSIDQVKSLMELMLDYQDHIDLKHKLALASLIRNFFSDLPGLIDRVQRLSVINTCDDEVT